MTKHIICRCGKVYQLPEDQSTRGLTCRACGQPLGDDDHDDDDSNAADTTLLRWVVGGSVAVLVIAVLLLVALPKWRESSSLSPSATKDMVAKEIGEGQAPQANKTDTKANIKQPVQVTTLATKDAPKTAVPPPPIKQSPTPPPPSNPADGPIAPRPGHVSATRRRLRERRRHHAHADPLAQQGEHRQG